MAVLKKEKEVKEEEVKVGKPKKYKLLANINGYTKGTEKELTVAEVRSFGEKYIKEIK